MSNMTMIWRINNNTPDRMLDTLKECKPGDVHKSPAAKIFGIEWVLHLFPNGANTNKLGDVQCFAIPLLPSTEIKQISLKGRLLIDELSLLAPQEKTEMYFGASVNKYCNEFESRFQLSHLIKLDTLTISAEFELMDVISIYGNIKTLWLENPQTALDIKKKQKQLMLNGNEIKTDKREIKHIKVKSCNERDFSMDDGQIESDNEDGQIHSSQLNRSVSRSPSRGHYRSHSRSRSRNRINRHNKTHVHSYNNRERYNHNRDKRRHNRHYRKRIRKHNKQRNNNNKDLLSDSNGSKSNSNSITSDVGLQKVITDSITSDMNGHTSPTYPYQNRNQNTRFELVKSNPITQIKEMLMQNNNNNNNNNGVGVSMDEFNKYKHEMYEWGQTLISDVNDKIAHFGKRLDEINNVKGKSTVEPVEAKGKLKHWLTNVVQLGRYYDVFVQNGFENMDFLLLIGDNELNDMNIHKIGHRMQILNQVHTLKEKENGLKCENGNYS